MTKEPDRADFAGQVEALVREHGHPQSWAIRKSPAGFFYLLGSQGAVIATFTEEPKLWRIFAACVWAVDTWQTIVARPAPPPKETN